MFKRYMFIVVVTLLGLGLVFWLGQTEEMSSSAVVEELQVVGTYENFKRLVEEIDTRESKRTFRLFSGRGVEEKATATAEDTADGGGNGSYSSTNIQVSGVDEADIVKNDGTYIYKLIENELVIAKVNPIEEMAVVYRERYDETSQFYPYEMYVDNEQLVVIGTKYEEIIRNYDEHKVYTVLKVYELNNRKDVKLVRELEVEGYYLSSRKIDENVYVITNKHLPYYLLHRVEGEKELEETLTNMKPTYRDTAISLEEQTIEWDETYFFPQSKETNYLIVAGVNISDANKPMQVSAYLGAGQTVYSTKEHLYVTRTHYEKDARPLAKLSDMVTAVDTKQETYIAKFLVEKGKVTFLGEGKVEGALLNQFSMDEHQGYFRIATTVGDMWSESNPSENLLFILDDNLQVVGKIEGIAKGERIFSARFIGDRGYIVTFKQVDPLFVLDLKNPKEPKILGELKIPGFSDYLHPYDENHLIGFGKDTEETNNGQAFVRGFKMALFDITDVGNPIEKFVEIIGSSGTHSELLYNHKALLFSKEKDIIAFPIEVYGNNVQPNNNRIMYPSFTFQGGLIYGLDFEKGFQLKANITHYDNKEIIEKNYDYNKHVSRMLYIDEHLYALSNSKVTAHDLIQFHKKNELNLLKKE